MPVVNIHEAKTNLSRLVEEALKGEEIIIAKAGKPLVKLIPYSSVKERKPGRFKGKIKISPDFDEPVDEFLELFEGKDE